VAVILTQGICTKEMQYLAGLTAQMHHCISAMQSQYMLSHLFINE